MIIRVAAVGAALVAGCGTGARSATSPAWVDDLSLTVRSPAASATAGPVAEITVADTYRAVASRIIAAARDDRGAYDKLRYLTDRIGHRLSGSKELDLAIAWAAKAMRDDGHDVHTEEVMVPHWVRGSETGEIITPQARKLHLIGLGGTVATPKAGITAPVVVVHGWDELDTRKDAIKGAIVLYDVAMPAWTADKGSGYGDVVPFRTAGAVEAAKRGAVGMLMRSVTAHSLGTPHTGAMKYDDKVTKIPAAAITVEDATLIARLAAAGDKVTVKLALQSRVLPDAKSANVIGELRGRELPDEIVVIGAHLDSWDVGQGAHDDGAGVVIMMQALTTLRRLGTVPRRTIRVVLFTNEENGTRGAAGYLAAHTAELAHHVAAIESDSGGFAPVGFDIDAADEASKARIQARVGDLVGVLAPIGAMTVGPGHSGADIDPLVKGGVPGLGLRVDGRRYFDYHHTEADTFDKIDAAELAEDVGAVAATAYMLADLPARLDAADDDPGAHAQGSVTRELLARLLEAPLAVADELAPLDAIVVLGAPLTRTDRMSPVLAERVAAAATLYARGGAPLVVTTGGVTARATRAEAAVMAEALIAGGVPADAILVEDQARHTADNASLVAALLGDRRRVWLVTQPFHARRARWLFRRAGFEPRVWHIADSLQYRDRRKALRWLTREYGAWIKALMRGRRP